MPAIQPFTFRRGCRRCSPRRVIRVSRSCSRQVDLRTSPRIRAPDGSLPYRRSYCASVDIELSRKREEKRNPKRRVSPGMWLRDSSLELYRESSYNFARLISFLIFRSTRICLKCLYYSKERIRIKN